MQMINDFKQYYSICNQILLRRFTSVFMILKNNCSLCFKTWLKWTSMYMQTALRAFIAALPIMTVNGCCLLKPNMKQNTQRDR